MRSLEDKFSPEKVIQRLGLQVAGMELSDSEPEPEPEPEPEFDWSNPPPEFFETLGVKPGGFPKPEEVRNEARGRVKKIFEDWTVLNRIVERHESAIRKRWTKRTTEQRRKLLLRAWPGMPRKHSPDFWAFLKKLDDVNAYKWPQINQEDLVKSKLFLMMVNSRARSYPSAFAAADMELWRFGFASGKIRPIFLNEYVMMFTGRDTPETYGQLYSWEDHEDAFTWLMSMKGNHPGEGLMVLEVQEGIYDFLVKCCLDLLSDMDPVALKEGHGPIQPEPALLSAKEPEAVDTLATIAAEANYRVPAKLDVEQLKKLVEAQRSVALDHVWSMREDPGYFSDVMKEMMEHRQELIPDASGNKHSFARQAGQPRLWARIQSICIDRSYYALLYWDAIYNQVCELHKLFTRHARNLKPEDDLPEELLICFLKLDNILDKYTHYPAASLELDGPGSPELKKFFVRFPEQDERNIGLKSKPMVQVNGRVKDTWARLRFLLSSIWEDHRRNLAGFDRLMDEVQRMIDSEPIAKDLISPTVAHHLGELSVLAECRRQLNLFQPWASSFVSARVTYEKLIEQDYQKLTTSVQKIHSQVSEKDYVDLGIYKLGNPTDGKFTYPVDKKRNRENTISMQKAERNLDAFWKAADRLLDKTGIYKEPVFVSFLTKATMYRTPDWVNPREPQKQPSALERETDIPISELHFDLERKTQSTLGQQQTATQPPSKIKSRGTPAEMTTTDRPSNNNEQEPITAPDHQPTFSLNKRAYKVFSSLFYQPNQNSPPGELPWKDFIYAMGLTGFNVQKLYGSVWQFTPTNLDVERSILFHEPHPSNKVSFRILRHFGRRLFRAYGWRGDMFKLEE